MTELKIQVLCLSFGFHRAIFDEVLEDVKEDKDRSVKD